METATQFAHQCLGSPIAGTSDIAATAEPRCWLCGGETHGVGWPDLYRQLIARYGQRW